MIPRPPTSTLFPYTTLFRSSTTFLHGPAGERTEGLEYQREDHPTQRRLQEALAALEDGECALAFASGMAAITRSEEHTSELQSPVHLVCRLLLEKKKQHVLL